MRGRLSWVALGAALGLVAAPIARGQEQVVDETAGVVAEETRTDGGATAFLRDEEGRVIAERHPDGTVVRYWYDAEGTRHVVPE